MSEKPHFIRRFRDDSTLANQGAGKTIEKALKELPWNQQEKGRLLRSKKMNSASNSEKVHCFSEGEKEIYASRLI